MTGPAPAPRAWRAHPRWYAVVVAGVVASIPLIVRHRIPLTAEFSILVLLTVLTGIGRRAPVLWAWTAWLAAIVALDDLRGLQAVVGPPHGADVIAAEHRLFGSQPVLALQHAWARPGLQPWDVALAAVYLLHSPAPLLCGAALWRWRRRWFAPFVASMVISATAALAVYLAYPEMPPWLAAEHGLLAPVRRITSEVVARAGPFSGVYGGADPLPNAAMPSLHVTYPCLVAWWTVRAFGWRAASIALYPLVIVVAVVYLGEHWVVDVLAGVALAAVAAAGSARLTALRRRGAPTRPGAGP